MHYHSRCLYFSLFLLFPLFLSGCEGSGAESSTDSNRAILVSIDALNEQILRETLTPEETPALYEIFENGACADYAISAFPSLTAPSHSSIWTGAYGDVTGISGNSQHRLPRSEYRITDTWSGFHYDPLSAESIWISAGRNGMRVAAHQTTQAPGVPGYLPRTGERTDSLQQRRSEAEEILSGNKVMAFNGYNRMISGDALLRAEDVTWTAAEEWSGLNGLVTNVDPKAFTFENSAGIFFGLLYGLNSYDSVLISATPSVSESIQATAAEPQTARSSTDLAQHFSQALEVPVENGTVFLRVRLFEIEDDGSSFMLYHPRLHVVEANREDLRNDYDRAVRGWIGNSAVGLYRNGAFGATYPEGGSGLAEQRYLETAELMTRQLMRAADWLWNEKDPQFMLDYFPLSDTIDHTILGYLEKSAPMYDEDLAEKISDFRAAVWGYTDMRVRHLMDLADSKDAAFFITGDHGMRSSWNVFYPNLALIEAGLLTLDESGEVDLSRTKAYAPNGYWITINSEEWNEGIVTDEEVYEVIGQVADALTGVQTESGDRVITEIYTPEGHPGLGLGGAAGGDIYWGLSAGFRSSSSLRGDHITESADLRTGHGFPSIDPDMYTAFCVSGGGFAQGRMEAIRTIDIAPTVAEYLGIEAPQDARGESVLRYLRKSGE